MSKIEIKGDDNHVYNDIKKSRINSSDNTTKNYSTAKWIGIASLFVTIIGLLLGYWKDIVSFFDN